VFPTTVADVTWAIRELERRVDLVEEGKSVAHVRASTQTTQATAWAQRGVSAN
jgi:hypothetical protein